MVRTRVEILFPSGTVPGTSDTLATVVPVRDGVAGSGVTSVAVTAGKTLRITSIELTMRNSAASQGRVTLNVRSNPSGATVIGSQTLGTFEASSTGAIVGQTETVTVPIPEGLEPSGANTLGFSFASTVGTEVCSACARGYEYSTPAPALR